MQIPRLAQRARSLGMTSVKSCQLPKRSEAKAVSLLELFPRPKALADTNQAISLGDSELFGREIVPRRGLLRGYSNNEIGSPIGLPFCLKPGSLGSPQELWLARDDNPYFSFA